MIPDEAVEAAGEAFLRESIKRKGELGASSMALLAALEAAAPHLLASLADEREGDLFRFTISQREWLRRNV